MDFKSNEHSISNIQAQGRSNRLSVTISRDLLKEAMDVIDNEATGTANAYYAELRDKIYHVLNPVDTRLRCTACYGSGFIVRPQVGGFVNTSTCLNCEGTGKLNIKQ